MNYSRLILSGGGILFLILGSLAFLNNNFMGIRIEGIQGLMYVISAMFAFAAVMQGTVETTRFSRIACLIYAIIALMGTISAGDSLVGLFHTTAVENILHTFITLGLFYLGYEAKFSFPEGLRYKRPA